MNSVIQKINTSLANLEIRVGLIGSSLIFGSLMLGLAMIYVAPHFEAGFNGLQYSILSKDPFDFHSPNSFRYRILAPLLGYITGLRGRLFFLIPLIFALLMLSAIYWSYRRKQFTPVESILMSSIIAFSSIILIQLIAPGYTDAVYYFFLFLTFVFIRKPYISALFFCSGLLTHESLLFMLPGLALYAWHLNKNDLQHVLKYVFLLVIAIIPLLIYRYWVSTHIAVLYDANFYFSHRNISFTLSKVLPHLPLGLFFVFKLMWLLPLYVLFKAFQKRNYSLIIVLTVMIICDLAQLIIAYDVTRMLCLAFPLMMISVEELKRELPEKKFTYIILILLLINFFIPQYFMTSDGPLRMVSVFSNS